MTTEETQAQGKPEADDVREGLTRIGLELHQARLEDYHHAHAHRDAMAQREAERLKADLEELAAWKAHRAKLEAIWEREIAAMERVATALEAHLPQPANRRKAGARRRAAKP